MDTYRTTFVNKRSHKVSVWDGGNLIAVVEPGAEETVISNDPRTEFARFSKVTYLPGDRVEVKQNKDWRCPLEGLLLDLENVDGAEEETFQLNGDFCTVYQGIPKTVVVDPRDPLARFSKIVWVKEPVQMQGLGSDYQVDVVKVVKKKIPRPDAEWAKITAQLKADAETEHRREMERKFGKSAEQA